MQDILFRILHSISPALAGGLGSALFLAWLYRGMRDDDYIKNPKADVFVYSARTKVIMVGIGLCCLVFAIGPLVVVSLKYYGPDPILSSHFCYRPYEDWSAILCLFIGFGLSSIACLVDPIKYFARLDDEGITVRGLFSGVRCLRWADIDQVKNNHSFQMISLRGTDKSGRSRRIWVPHYISGFPVIIERLNQHGLFFKEQEEEINAIKSYLSEQGYSSPIFYKHYSPFLSLWCLSAEPAQYIAVVFDVTENQEYHLEHVVTQGSPADTLEDVRNRLLVKGFAFHPEFQQDIAADMLDIISSLRNP